MKLAKIGLLIALASGLVCHSFSQSHTAPDQVEAQTGKLSQKLTKNLQGYDPKVGVSREKREQAYAKLLEGQRSFYRMQLQRTQVAVLATADTARSSLVAALEADPGLSEAYVALAEITVLASHDTDEAVSLASLATGLNKDSVGGHRLLARLFTKQSGLRGSSLNPDIAEKAAREWKDVTRLDPRSAEGWALLAEIFERTGKSNEAIDALRKWMAASTPVDTGWYRLLIGGRPEDLAPEQAPLRLAGALTKAGRTSEAVEVLAQQLSDDPDDPNLIGAIQEVIDNSKPGTAAAAIEPIRLIVTNHPESLTLLQFFATLDAKTGNISEAINMLRAAADRLGGKDRPATANLLLTTGDILAASGKFPEAAAEYEKALAARGLDSAQTLDPEEREFGMAVFQKLISAYKRSNRLDDARAAIERARKMFGREDLFADRELVSLYRENGDRDKALLTVRNIRSKYPEDVSLLRLEATLLTETGKVDEAVALITRRIESGKSELPVERFSGKSAAVPRLDDDFSNYVFICQLYNDAGRGTDAAAAADRAYQVAGSDDRKQIAQLMLATARQTAGQFDDAESILRDLLKQSPRNPIALNNLGYFLVERGTRLPEALDLIERAVAIDPTNPSYLDSLGWALFKLGRINEAVTKLEEAESLDDASATIHEHLGDAYQKKGSLEQARTAWQRAFVLSSVPADAARVKEKLENAK